MREAVKREFEATLVVKYRFEVQPESSAVRVYDGSSFCGYVSNGDSTAGGLPGEVVEAARKFLYEVRPDLNLWATRLETSPEPSGEGSGISAPELTNDECADFILRYLKNLGKDEAFKRTLLRVVARDGIRKTVSGLVESIKEFGPYRR